MTNFATLHDIERQVLWTAMWTIHNANALREKKDGDVKVGGHQASSASMVSILTALYFHTLRPEDRVAVKPHAAPAFHAIQYLAGQQTQAKLEAFRGYGGAQSYPSRTKDIDDVDFSTGSVGLGVAITAFASLIQDYVVAKSWSDRPKGRMVALIGDAEMDEGNIFECLLEGWKHDIRNCWWIIDYNRQSLDGIVHEGLWARFEAIFASFGWNIVRLKHGAQQRAAFEEPGGDRLRDWIDNCPNADFSALTFQGCDAWRARLMDDIGDQGDVTALLDRRGNEELAALMTDLGGHCLESLTEAFGSIDDDRPTLFLAYTVKGWGTPLAGHKDNHAGIMTAAQIADLKTSLGVAEGAEWAADAALQDVAKAKAAIAAAPFFAKGPRRYTSPAVPAPTLAAPTDRAISTQAAFGRILDGMAKSGGPLSDRIVTAAPDVTVSTGLGPWVNRRGLFARDTRGDTFRDAQVPSTQRWAFSPEGQHLELGIAEMNLFLVLAAAGLSHSLFGERLIPIGTVYDPFVCRGLDALNHACYQDARFIVAGTPSGVTLAPEGGAHQSIGTPLIGISQDGLASFEPAYADELARIMEWSFDYLQRDGEGDPDERTWLRDETGGSVYLRLSTRPVEQALRSPDAEFDQGVIDGAYWLRRPGPTPDVILAYQGAVAPDVVEAAGRIGQDRRDTGVLAITSADRLNAGWTAAKRARQRSHKGARAWIERMLAPVPRDCTIVTIIDGHPLTLGWLGAVAGHRTGPLGVEHFGQTGRVSDLYRHYGIDAAGIVAAVDEMTAGRPVRLVG